MPTRNNFYTLLTISFLFLSYSIRAEEIVGTLPSDFSVDSKGAANYSIPLQIPPGINGMQPNLILNYNSQTGNGPFGVGWSLSTGFPASISRGRSIYARDGEVRGIEFEDTDKLYLDGKRLICVNNTPEKYWAVGNEYRTEVDSFMKIKSFGSTAHGIEKFVATTKEGVEYTFGALGNSIDAYNSSGTPNLSKEAMSYKLKQVEDLSENKIKLTYSPDSNGQHHLFQISYAYDDMGISLQAIRFDLEVRTDTVKQYVNGKPFSLFERVQNIDILINSSRYSSYHFDYETSAATQKSILKAVTAYYRDGASNQTSFDNLPATILNYSDPAISDYEFLSNIDYYALPEGILDMHQFQRELTADFNGDGLTDLFVLQSEFYRSQEIMLVALSTGNGFTDYKPWFSSSALINSQGDQYYLDDLIECTAGDFNGDGLSDIAVLGIGVFISNGNSFTWNKGWAADYPDNSIDYKWNRGEQIFPARDINSDGFDDIPVFHGGAHHVLLSDGIGSFKDKDVLNYNTLGAPSGSAWRDFTNSGIPFGAEYIDLNGDGLLDFIRLDRLKANNEDYLECIVNLNSSTGFSADQIWSFNVPDYLKQNNVRSTLGLNRQYLTDVTGDGIPDVVIVNQKIYVAIGTGAGFEDIPASAVWFTSDGDIPYDILFKSGDFNNDGKADFMSFRNDAGIIVLFSNGTKFFEKLVLKSIVNVEGAAPAATSGGGRGASNTHSGFGYNRLADVNGDGLVDLIGRYLRSDSKREYHYLAINGGMKADLVTEIENGLGTKTKIEYKPITDDSVYTKGTGTTYPIREVQNSRYVVSDIYKDVGGDFDGGDQYRISYSYSGNRVDLSGRGDLGFQSFVTFDHQTDLLAYQFLSQSYPMTGLANREQTYRAINVEKGVGGNVSSFDLLPISSQDNDVIFDEVDIPGIGRQGTVYPFMSHSAKLSWEYKASNPLAINVENPSSLFDQYNQLYPSNNILAHSRLHTYVWFDDQNQNTLPSTQLPSGYDDSSGYVPGQQDATSVGFLDWYRSGPSVDALSNFSLPGEITYGNLKRTRIDYGDGYQTDSVVDYYVPNSSTETTGLEFTGLVKSSQTIATTPTEFEGSEGQGSPITEFDYNFGNGLLVSKKINAGDSTVFESDPRLSTTETYSHTTYGQLESTSLDGYDALGPYLVKDVNLLKQVVQWDSTKRFPKKTQNSLGHFTETSYDVLGRPELELNSNDETAISNNKPAGIKTHYDANSRVTKVENLLLGLTAESEFGLTTGANIQTVPPPSTTGQSDEIVYEMTDALTQNSKYYEIVTADETPITTTYYDRLGRIIRVVKEAYASKSSVIDTIYDLQARVVAVSNPYDPADTSTGPSSTGRLYWTFTTYDDLGRAATITAPNGTVTKTEYKGRISSVTIDAVDRDSQTTTTLVNVKDETIKVWNADNVPGYTTFDRGSGTPSIEFFYDAFGRMIKTKTWQGADILDGMDFFQNIYAEYDALGNQTRLDDPDKGTWDYIYNGLGQITWQMDANGNTVIFNYDELGRPLERFTQQPSSSETATWCYYDTVNDPLKGLVNDPTNGWIGAVQKETVVSTDDKWFEGNHTSQNAYYYDPDTGNLEIELHEIDNKYLYRHFTYDSLNRPKATDFFWRPKGLSEDPHLFPENWRTYGYRYLYNNKGYVTTVLDSEDNTWWSADSINGYDYLDRPSKFIRGQGRQTVKKYYPITGLLKVIGSGFGEIQSDEYFYDGLGNLLMRGSFTHSVLERFKYDDLNRLTESKVLGGEMQYYDYYDNGNIKSKYSTSRGQSGIYAYTASQPHAVTAVEFQRTENDSTGTPVTVHSNYVMSYDANGNVKSRTGNGETWAFRWNAFDKPVWMGKETTTGTSGSAFIYGINRMRVAHYEFDSMYRYGSSDPLEWEPGHVTKKKLYIGGGTMEVDYKNLQSSGSRVWEMDRMRIYIPAPDGRAGSVEIDPEIEDKANFEKQIYYYDHLGSIVAIRDFGDTTSSLHSDLAGNQSLYSFDAWGERRDAKEWIGTHTDQTLFTHAGEDDLASRGFTGHEMMESLGLIHMNGRIYDPVLGRFLSADILTDNVLNTQGYNRYSYIKNNPLSGVDPSGYSENNPSLLDTFMSFFSSDNDNGSENYGGEKYTGPGNYFENKPYNAKEEVNKYLIRSAAEYGAGAAAAPIQWLYKGPRDMINLMATGQAMQGNTLGLIPAKWFSDFADSKLNSKYADQEATLAFLAADINSDFYVLGNISAHAEILVVEFLLPTPPIFSGTKTGSKGGWIAANKLPRNRPFAMGIDTHLDNFADFHNATTWKNFDDVMNWKPQVFDNLANPNKKVLFNLDDVDIWRGIDRAARGKDGATDWELLQIYQNPSFPNLEFWQGGSRVANPFD